MLDRVLGICKGAFKFESFEEVNPYFKRIINTFKQMNYSEYNSDKFKTLDADLGKILAEREVVHAN